MESPIFGAVERLKRYLAEHKITQADFAASLDVTQPTVSGWLNGDSLPSAQMLKRMSRETGLTIDDLLDHRTPTRRSELRA